MFNNFKIMSKTNTTTPSMILVSSSWGPTKTFKMLPASNDCPYVECIFNPSGKVLAIIGSTIKDTFHMVPRLDNNGEPEVRKGPGSDKEPHKKQRVTLQTFSEYYILEVNEIEAFIKIFAINEEEFDYKKYLDAPTMDNPSSILTGPTIQNESKLIIEP